MKVLKTFTLVMIVLLTACSETQAIPNTPVSITAASNSSIVSTPSPTQTLISGATPSPIIESIKTIPVATLNAVATLDARRASLVLRFPELQGYPVSWSLFSCYGIQISPNEETIVFTNDNVINLFEINGSKIGSYSFYDIYGYQIDYKGGYIEDIHWTDDGKYLYISANPGGDGGPESYLYYRSALIRVNLENGSWKDTEISGSFAVSPNDNYVIYSSHRSQVRIRNLSIGQEQIYSPTDYFLYFGKYVWSPDNKKVIFIGTPEDWYANDSKFAILLVDVESQLIHQLYESPLPFYFPVDWVDSNKVILNKFNESGEWILDLSVEPPTILP